MSNFSNNTSASNVKAIFTKHHVYEVASSLAESKQIADGYSSTHRWQHRAHVTIIGNPSIRPYDPIYLDGLPNGMSGYWTVLSVVHVFGGRPSNYFVELEVGTDIVGLTDPAAASRAGTRDLQSDLAGQSLVASDSTLTSYTLSPNANSLVLATGTTSPTSITSIGAVSIPNVPNITTYIDAPPDLTGVKKTIQWTSTKSSKVIS